MTFEFLHIQYPLNNRGFDKKAIGEWLSKKRRMQGAQLSSNETD